jgi:hypothetical protein
MIQLLKPLYLIFPGTRVKGRILYMKSEYQIVFCIIANYSAAAFINYSVDNYRSLRNVDKERSVNIIIVNADAWNLNF